MSLREKQRPCPKCNKTTITEHCKGTGCTWFMCTYCAPSGFRFLVFDYKSKRQFFSPADPLV